jgi:hypothetical protein
MSRYRVRVQLITWYEIVVIAPSSTDAHARAEMLRPAAIRMRGKRFREETGLADPFSPQLINDVASARGNGTPNLLSI